MRKQAGWAAGDIGRHYTAATARRCRPDDGLVDLPSTRTLDVPVHRPRRQHPPVGAVPGRDEGALSRHDAILRDAIEASRRQVVKTTGDGMMAVFAARSTRRPPASLPSAACRRALGRNRPAAGADGHPRRRGRAARRRLLRADGQPDRADHGGRPRRPGPPVGSAGALACERLPAGAGLLDLGEHRLKDLGRPGAPVPARPSGPASHFPPLVTAPGAGDLPVPASPR